MRRSFVSLNRCSRFRVASCTSNWSVPAPCSTILRRSLLGRPCPIPTRLASTHSASSRVTVSRDSTIYALSTASGRAGIAVVRISGPACLEIYEALCPQKPRLKPRVASVRTLFEPGNEQQVLDSAALLLYFPATKTVTGEDVLELHIHGGPATVKAVLAAIPRCAQDSSIRYAEAGEFTRRAFQNNRLDLAQVEALSDTLSAETELQRRAAVRGNSGVLGRTYEGWRHHLLYARGEVEAFIDFYEDQDFDTNEAEMLKSIEDQIRDIKQSIQLHVNASHRGELIRKGIRISMLGPPNAGKSSLLNRIVGREASIVSSEAGTTRDVVEVNLDMEGYLCTFADTAGLRSTDGAGATKLVGEIEAEGIRRAKAKAKESDLIIVFASVEEVDGHWEIVFDRGSLELAKQAEQHVIVVNKRDRVCDKTLTRLLQAFHDQVQQSICAKGRTFVISCKGTTESAASSQKDSVTTFVDGLVELFSSMTALEQQDLYGVTERQRQLLTACDQSLHDYLAEASGDQSGDFDIVLAAEYLRTAANCLSRITGRGEAGDVEEVLGVVFEKFCVGK